MQGTGSNLTGMLEFELLDETLDINRTQFYPLSIQASLDGFLFSILDPDAARYLALKSYRHERTLTTGQQYERISEILSQDPFLLRPYRGVSCIATEHRSTLLPAALFDRAQLKLYFEFNHILNEFDELHYNYLGKVDAYVVFPLNTDISNLFFKTWVNTGFNHQAAPFLEALFAVENENEVITGIHFNRDHFDIAVIEGKKLRYYNNFKFRSEEDMVYFILLVYDKLGLSQNAIPLVLAGTIDKTSDRPSYLRRYFKRIGFMTLPSGFIYPPSFQKLQEHIPVNLLTLIRCV
jgi:hypothetical protein